MEIPEKSGFPATLGYCVWALTLPPVAVVALKLSEWKLDTNWDTRDERDSSLPELFPLTDIFMPNEQEAMLISRRDSVESALDWFRQAGVPLVILKQGERGASVCSRGETLHLPVSPVAGGDSVGTGDSFDAGFLAGWLRGLHLTQCLEIACRCGRAVAGVVGGLQGQPSWDDVSYGVGPR